MYQYRFQVFGNIGTGLGYMVDPYIIHYDPMVPGYNASSIPEKDRMSHEEIRIIILWYLTAHAITLFLLFLVILVYFMVENLVVFGV